MYLIRLPHEFAEAKRFRRRAAPCVVYFNKPQTYEHVPLPAPVACAFTDPNTSRTAVVMTLNGVDERYVCTCDE